MPVPIVPGDSVAVPREVFADVLLAMAQVVRRLESHCPNPGVVDAAVLRHAQHCLIHGGAALKLAEAHADPLLALLAIETACSVAQKQASASVYDWRELAEWVGDRARAALPERNGGAS